MRQAKRSEAELSFSRSARGGTFPNILLLVYFVTKPYYLWSSGLPQVADVLMVLFVATQAIAAIRNRQVVQAKAFSTLLLLFALWCIAVNLVAAFFTGATSQFAMSSLFLLFNALVALAILIHGSRAPKSLVATIYYGSLIGLVTQALIILSGRGGGTSRASGLFNNPNQLAYYALLSLCLLLISHYYLRPTPRPTLTILAILAASSCIALSLSFAGLISLLVVLTSLAAVPPVAKRAARRQFRLLLTAIAAISLLLNSMTERLSSSTWFHFLEARLTQRQDVNIAEERGLDRFWEYPQYWITGAGEGAFDRFGAVNEVHSTIVNIQVSYGVVGLLLFSATVFSVMSMERFRHTPFILAPLVYGLTHNGIRNSLFWVLLAAVAILATAAPRGVQMPLSKPLHAALPTPARRSLSTRGSQQSRRGTPPPHAPLQ